MNLEIHKPELAQRVQAQIESGHFHDTDELIEKALDALDVQAAAAAPEQPEGQPLKPKKSAYGLLAKYGPGPTEEEIDESRREMFSGFGEIGP